MTGLMTHTRLLSIQSTCLFVAGLLHCRYPLPLFRRHPLRLATTSTRTLLLAALWDVFSCTIGRVHPPVRVVTWEILALISL